MKIQRSTQAKTLMAAKSFLEKAALLLFLGGCSDAEKPLSGYVNPFIGASAGTAHSYHGMGKTFPGAATPFGMVQVSPNTVTGGDNAPGYSYEHTSIEGFAFTQMSGVGWYGDLGNFLVMPATGELKTINGHPDNPASGYRSLYDKASEEASPAYYSVFLSDYGIRAEATAAPHSGMLRFTFPENSQSRIQVDLARRVGGSSVLQEVKMPDSVTIAGYMRCTPEGGGWGNGAGNVGYTVFFYAQCSRPLTRSGVWSADIPDGWPRKLGDVLSERYRERVEHAEVIRGVKEFRGKHVGFFAEFGTRQDEQILLKVGISFVDEEGAKRNLQAEIPGWDFDRVREAGKALWDDALGKIRVDGQSEEDKAVFYTALYHTMIDPRTCTDVDGRFRGGDGQVHLSGDFLRRTVFSGWDVFRSQMPLQTLINPQVVGDMLGSLTDLACESGKGYFERWELLNAYSGCMVGNPAISVLADACAKNIYAGDMEKAWQVAARTSELFGNGALGYLPSEKGYSVSETLEYAYSDWCMAQLAGATGRAGDAHRYGKRAEFYKNVFDTTEMCFRPKKQSGEWEPMPQEGRLKEWYGCIESNPYQQGWFVPHDVDGMAALMGGREKAARDLEAFFDSTPGHFLWNVYYNHANEVVHHAPFLFNRLGYPWLTQKWARTICRKAYGNAVEGLVGNEDVGQMSAWYVLAATGIHPVCPGSARYEIASPLFDKITLAPDKRYGKGKEFTIVVRSNSPKNIYIRQARLNGVEHSRPYIDFFEIANGGTLELVMGPTPNACWGKS
jgi:predicted alpha-1,2-mannosidase